MQTVPDSGMNVVEILPRNHFGDVGFASATLSPKEWISGRIGYLTFNPKQRRHITTFGLPVEVRREQPDLLLKLEPELSYETVDGAPAAALGLQSRLGATSLLANGLYVDKSFTSTDNLSRGFGRTKHEADFTLGHDILKDIRLKYYQHNRFYEFGEEHRYQATGGVHFAKYPHLEITAARNVVEADMTDTLYVTSFVPDSTDSTQINAVQTDSTVHLLLNNQKNKLQIKLYETSSPFVEKLLHLNRLSYELAYTTFNTTRPGQVGKGYGNIMYGRLVVSPLSSLTLTGIGTLRKNPQGSLYSTEYLVPAVMLQTIDLPRGADISLKYDIRFGSVSEADSSALTLNRSAFLTLKPGRWTRVLGWFSPFGGIIQSADCSFDEKLPHIARIVFADRGVVLKTLTPSVGANIYPTSELLFRNENTWTTMEGDSTKKFRTFNDLKWWFGGNRLWQTRWEYDRKLVGETEEDHHHQGYTRYDRTWSSWLKTASGWAVDVHHTDSTVAQDSSVAQRELRMGPELSTTLTVQRFLFIKKLLNGHELKTYWQKDQRGLDLSYALYLKVTVLPNISLTSYNSFTFEKGQMKLFNGNAGVMALF
jgi:hypothetical protein